jgi:hypothetical protein
MGYEGWASLAGTEIINNDRVRAYAASLIPNLRFDLGSNDEANGALRKMINDEPYRTPVLDDAPWVDPDDPDTSDFCGVLGLSVTGLSDSTRTATLVQNTGDGGAITGRRREVRSIRYSVLLVGATQAAVEAGQSWLNAALEGDCDGDCNGSNLCYLQALTDPQDWGDRVTSAIDRNKLSAASGRYDKHTFRFTPGNTTRQLSAPSFPRPLPCDDIVWTWDLSATAGTQVRLHTYNEKGQVFTDVLTIDSDGRGTKAISDKGLGETIARCAISLDIGTSVVVNSVSVEYRDDAKNTACFDHYYRQVVEASPIDGPTAVTEYAPNCGALRKVEFTIATGKAYQFGLTRTVSNTTNLLKVGDDQSALSFKLAKTIPVPSAPSKPTWIVDPACPKVPAPPRPVAAFSSCGAKPTYYYSYGFSLPGSMIPLWNEAVPWVRLDTGEKEARNVRVRFFPRPLGVWQDASDLDPASACGQFTVDYIPPDSLFYIDGQTQHASVTRPARKNTNADHLMSGVIGTDLFVWPVLTCGTDYMMVVDVDGASHALTGVWLRMASRY